MIQITCKDNEFAYDMKALAMVFYPEKQCVVQEQSEWKQRDGYSILWEMDGRVVYEDYFPRPYSKNQVKGRVYDFLCKLSGKKQAWGILTGIRPAKIPLRMYMQGLDRDQIWKCLIQEYRCSEEKAELALAVAEREFALTGHRNHRDSVNIYIGIPFCPSICSYCSFSSYLYAQYQNRIGEYLTALEKEMQFVSERLRTRGKTIQTLYIGGGTPTSLPETEFQRLLEITAKYFPTDCLDEYTVEAGRPDSITGEKLQMMREYQVSRISINPQTMKQDTLEIMGRKHTVEQIHQVFAQARQLGFDNINMDLIVGLPEESPDDFKESMEEVMKLQPDSITVHTLVIKRASRLRREQLENGNAIADEEKMIPVMQDFAQKFCRENGYEPYYMYRQKNKASTTRNTNQENVAYAKPGKECLYNIFIMEELESIVALGSGGASKIVFHGEDRMERIENVKSVEDYIGRIDEMLERKKQFM